MMLKLIAMLTLLLATPAIAASAAKAEARAEAKAERQAARAERRSERHGGSLPLSSAAIPVVAGLAVMGLRRWRRRG